MEQPPEDRPAKPPLLPLQCALLSLFRSRARRIRFVSSRAVHLVWALISPRRYEWAFSYDDGCQRGARQSDYESTLRSLGSFGSVQDFWRYWNTLMAQYGILSSLRFRLLGSLSHGCGRPLPDTSNLRLFKADITPSWEPPANAKGGRGVRGPPVLSEKRIRREKRKKEER